jgi:pyridoxamine 5'-phosphate oxidase
MPRTLDLAALRGSYSRDGLSEAEAGPDPLRLFARWFEEAEGARVPEPNAMTLATVGPDGAPTARVVLLKEVDEEGGFVFYTNFRSRKGRDLEAHPRGALVFWWAEVERQVRVEGPVEAVDPAASDAYFAVRPRGSQLGAWASDQSRPIGGREELEARLAELEARFDGQPVPRPPYWGGYRLRPDALEFWQGRPDRLHDRLLYIARGGEWALQRLAP